MNSFKPERVRTGPVLLVLYHFTDKQGNSHVHGIYGMLTPEIIPLNVEASINELQSTVATEGDKKIRTWQILLSTSFLQICF